MSETIGVTTTVQIGNALARRVTASLTVDSYDVIAVDIPPAVDASAPPVVVDVQPGGADRPRFLMIEASAWSVGDNLQYAVQEDCSGTVYGSETQPPLAWVSLEHPQVFVGNVTIGLIPNGPPRKLALRNTRDSNSAAVTVRILVGRNAVSTG